jgi:hypothetical protein
MPLAMTRDGKSLLLTYSALESAVAAAHIKDGNGRHGQVDESR